MSASAPAAPVLLCFDGSDDAAAAIARAGQLLGTRPAVVLTVWEPAAMWEPYDPGAILSAGVGKLAERALGFDEVVQELAEDKMTRGVALAARAGFAATGRIAEGKAWSVICEIADEIGAVAIVLGARGRSPVRSALLGSVSAAVIAHARQLVLVSPPRSA